MGFEVIDLFSDLSQIDVDKAVFHGLLGRGTALGEDVMLFKPTTFMNLSGTAVQEVIHYFKVPLEDVVVIFDDMALSPGKIRLRLDGSSGGHKGMQNIIDCLSTENIKRIRVGIGEPEIDSIDYVLSKPVDEEKEAIDTAISIMRKYQRIQKIVEAWRENGLDYDSCDAMENIERVVEDGNVD